MVCERLMESIRNSTVNPVTSGISSERIAIKNSSLKNKNIPNIYS